MRLPTLLFTIVLSCFSFADEVVSRSAGEQCFIPDRLPIAGAEYKKKDLKTEKELCSYDFHQETTTEQGTAVALCPKLFSTFPAVELIEIPEGDSKLNYEAQSCNETVSKKNKGKKLAKYKFSMSCAKTPSILGYYHLSRALELDIVPVAVLRTMKQEKHLEVALKGEENSKTDPAELISKNWASLVKLLNRRDESIMTADKEYSIGALSENPRGEQKYYEDFYPGASGEEGVRKFKSTGLYKKLSTDKSVLEMIGRELTSENYMALKKMKDAVDMIILDKIFGQQDRFGNVHSLHTFLTTKEGALEKWSLKDVEKMIEENGTEDEKNEFKKAKKMPSDWRKEVEARNKALLAVVSKYLQRNQIAFAHAQEIFLKDNDCGLKGSNVFKSHKLIESVRHINKTTYLQLMRLHQKVSKGEIDNSFWTKTLLMNDKEFVEFKSGLEYAAQTLLQKCQAGKLFLDLNITEHFSNQVPAEVNCTAL
ncbi:hypothetical protein K2X05_05890 [bacterium]|nr:hypothetical protein [bacterium]